MSYISIVVVKPWYISIYMLNLLYCTRYIRMLHAFDENWVLVEQYLHFFMFKYSFCVIGIGYTVWGDDGNGDWGEKIQSFLFSFIHPSQFWIGKCIINDFFLTIIYLAINIFRVLSFGAYEESLWTIRGNKLINCMHYLS